ncbi:MAG: CpaF family protein [Micromonosporaceae bacterium]|nr:CpaF family protein [Micromonosporaceae bacterium]
MGETELAVMLRGRVAARMAAHAGGGRLPVARRRQLVEQYTAEVLDAHARECLAGGQVPLPGQAEARISRAIVDHLAGAGGLQELLDDKDVENVDANGCDQVFVRYTDGRVEVAPAIAASDEDLVELIRSLASAVAFGDDSKGTGEERAFDRNNPSLDLRLPDGSRLAALMSVCKRPSLSIRRPTMIDADLDELARRGMLDPGLCEVLQAGMRARVNIIFGGGTNLGKTTIARAAARAIPAEERLVTIEDAYELELFDPVAHPNVVAMQARRPNLEGVGAVPMAALLRTALRFNPDRVVVGEARGDEVIELLKAMTQGNDGSFATVHCSSSAQAFSRLMMYAVQAPERLSFEASAMLIAEAVHWVVHLAWTPDRQRVVSSVREVVGCEGRDVISNEVWRPGPDRRAVPATPLRAEALDRLEAAGLAPSVIDRIGW